MGREWPWQVKGTVLVVSERQGQHGGGRGQAAAGWDTGSCLALILTLKGKIGHGVCSVRVGVVQCGGQWWWVSLQVRKKKLSASCMCVASLVVIRQVSRPVANGMSMFAPTPNALRPGSAQKERKQHDAGMGSEECLARVETGAESIRRGSSTHTCTAGQST